MNITLEQLLKSRDERQQTQRTLLRDYPDKTLVCLTVIMPGKQKRNKYSLVVARCATELLDDLFAKIVVFKQEKDLQTGFEAYFVVDKDSLWCKKETCKLENTHPLGRLFDIDVISKNGVPISRQEIGFAPRKCLICDKESRYCMRNFTHTQEEIQEKIHEMVDGWLLTR